MADRQFALAAFLKAASGAEAVEISRLSLLAGGAIQENWGVDANFEGGCLAGAQRLLLRTDAPTGVPSSLDRVEEFAVLKAAFAAGVAVPEPLFACADAAVLGKPFFVMRRVAGSAAGRQITLDLALEAARPGIAERLGRELARLQTIRPPRADLGFLAETDAEKHIAQFRAYLDRHPNPRPVLEWALRWAEAQLPEKLPPVLCHRDFRTGNYMLEGTRLTAILDWEFAGWGDPDEDIGWLCCKGWRFGRLDREAGGIADRAPFYRGYEEESGRRLDPERVRFWEVIANLRWAVIALQQSDRYLIGGARNLSTAITGRRATECELELLMLLDVEGVPLAPTAVPANSAGGDHSHPGPPLTRGREARWTGAATLPLDEGGQGGGETLRDLPASLDLLALAREVLLDEVVPLLPPERVRDAHLIATVMAVVAREAHAGEGWQREVGAELTGLYAAAAPHRDLLPARGEESLFTPRPACGEREGPIAQQWEGEGQRSALATAEQHLLARFAADLRNGAFETSPSRAAAARAILWRLTSEKLREGNPHFLAANGFGPAGGFKT